MERKLFKDLPQKKKWSIYNRIRQLKNKGVSIKPQALLDHLTRIAFQREGMKRPVLCVLNGRIVWREHRELIDKGGVYRSGKRWYIRGVRGESFLSRELALAWKNEDPFADCKPKAEYIPGYDQTTQNEGF